MYAAMSESPTPTGPEVQPATPVAVPWWALHRRCYDWTLSFAHSRFDTPALFAFSMAEAIFFPIPVMALQIPMSLERRERTWWYGVVTQFGSMVGGVIGYQVGHLFSGRVRGLFSEHALHHLSEFTGNLWLLTGGAVAIHPFKLFTIASGIFHVPFWEFLLAMTVGRSVLVFGIAWLLWRFGAPVRVLIDRYFTLLTVLFGLALIGVVLVARVL